MPSTSQRNSGCWPLNLQTRLGSVYDLAGNEFHIIEPWYNGVTDHAYIRQVNVLSLTHSKGGYIDLHVSHYQTSQLT